MTEPSEASKTVRTDASVSEVLDELRIDLAGESLRRVAAKSPGLEAIPSTLPAEFDNAELVVFIPAYRRQISDDGTSLGTFPVLVRQLLEAAEREELQIAVLISDDTPLDAAADTTAALRVALSGLETDSRVFLCGRRERAQLFATIEAELEERLRSLGTGRELEKLMNAASFLATHHGYGPQRVRAQGMTAGITQPVMSRDSDLLLIHAEALQSPYSPDQAKPSFQYVFIDDATEAATPVAHNPSATFLKHATELGVGSTLREISRKFPETELYSRVEVTKDKGMIEFLKDPAKGASYHIAAEDRVSSKTMDAELVSLMDIVWGAPDLNGYSALLNRVYSGEQAIKSFAIPAGVQLTAKNGYPGILVDQTPNPTCVETRSSREARHLVPWLVTNPNISGEGGKLLQTGARAEDQLLAKNEDAMLLMAYSTCMPYHSRAQDGRDEDALQNFLSEDLGDILAGLVKQRTSFVPGANEWFFDTTGVFSNTDQTALNPKVVEEELRGQIEEVWKRIESVRAVISDELAKGNGRAEGLGQLLGGIDERCTSNYPAFEARVLDYLAQQTSFVNSVFRVYPSLLEAMSTARQRGEFPTLEWRSSWPSVSTIAHGDGASDDLT